MRGAGHRFALVALVLTPQHAWAQPAPSALPPVNRNVAAAVTPTAGHMVTLRVGTHGVVGRVVFKLGKGQSDSEDRSGDAFFVRLPGAGAVPGAPRGTTNILSVAGGPDGAVLNLAPGSVTRVWRQGGLLGIDVSMASPPAGAARPMPPGGTASRSATFVDPLANQRVAWASFTAPNIETMPTAPPAPARRPAENSAPPNRAATPNRAPLQIELVPIGSAAAIPAAEKPPQPPVVATPAALPGTQPGPGASRPAAGAANEAGAALAAVRLPGDPVTHEESILLPFDAEVGAAAFALGGSGHVVFDDAKPVDLAALKDDRVFGGAIVTLLLSATHFSLKLAPGTRLRLHRRPDGWVVAVAPTGGLEDTADIIEKDGMINIGEHGAADTVVMDDPATGGHLLVGTVLTPGPPVAVGHRSAEFTLLPSWTGVAVVPQSDRIVLRADKAGFQLGTATGPKLAAVYDGHVEQALENAGNLTRHFDFTDLPTATLMARLGSDMGAVAAAPRLDRLRPRVRAAREMIGLGLDHEAAAVLRVAMEDDPRGVTDADAQALLAMADWLGDRFGDAGKAAPMSGSDEAALWRAVIDRDLPAQAAAATLAADWRLLLAYPTPLRRRLVPAVARILLAGAQDLAAAALLERISDPELDDARALLLAHQGKRGEALALLDRLAGEPDRQRAAMAARDAVELRLAAGKLTPGEAAAALESRLYAWRDDANELALRLRVAALQSQAGTPRPALSLLRETDALFPDAHDQVREAERQVLESMLKGGAGRSLSPLDLVSLVAENQDLLADQSAANTLTPVLVDKLMALDLPDRAAPLLQHLMEASSPGEAKAGLGARLADLQLDQDDARGALAALDASAPAASVPLPGALATRRTIQRARALAASNQDAAAVRLLMPETGAEALSLRAQLCERLHDWAAAGSALRALTQATIPAHGALTDAQQDLVLRLASDASQSGDMAELQELRAGDGTRLSPGPRQELFRALTAQPVQSLGDLPRSARETAADRALPAVLTSYPTH